MDISVYYYYTKLCEELNFTTAAEKSFISRQAMQHALKTLESFYGMPLIVNNHNHLSLTPEGQTLYDNAIKLITVKNEMDHSMEKEVSSDIKIAISNSLIPFYAPETMDAIGKFIDKNNIPSGNIHTVLNYEALEGVLSKKYECALIISMPLKNEKIHEIPLSSSSITILMNRQNPLIDKNSIELSDLSNKKITCWGDPKIFFSQLHSDMLSKGITANYEIVPQFYEASTKINSGDYLGFDRLPDEVAHYMDPLINKKFCGNKYKVYCELISLTENAPLIRSIASKLTEHSVLN
ncbi:DNA-binding transcriptional regulator, LysR family [Lachnospiraceae bacterium KH1T2]|nr:DNA-binding transcriptional regulator, LysR family [Lachnospiraceae bacterium KH1T2]